MSTDEGLDGWGEWRDRSTAIGIDFPPGWQAAEALLGTEVAFLFPDRDPLRFRANLNLVLQPTDGIPDAADLQRRHRSEVLEGLEETHLLDAAATSVAGRPASRVLVAYRSGDDELTLEQWIVPIADRLAVVSATAATADYPELADVFGEMVARVTLDA